MQIISCSRKIKRGIAAFQDGFRFFYRADALVKILRSEEFVNRLTIFHSKNRATFIIDIVCIKGDTHISIDGRCQISRSDGAMFDLTAVMFAGSNDLSVIHTTAGQAH